MKKIIFFLLLGTLSLHATNANAQKLSKQLSFGFGVEAGVVTGDVNEIYNITGGFTARGSYKLGPGFATLTTGALILFPKSLEGEDIKAGLVIPVKAGYKFIFKDRFFAMGELGYSTIKTYDGDYTYSEGGFTYAPSIGAQFGTFEISLR